MQESSPGLPSVSRITVELKVQRTYTFDPSLLPLEAIRTAINSVTDEFGDALVEITSIHPNQ